MRIGVAMAMATIDLGGTPQLAARGERRQLGVWENGGNGRLSPGGEGVGGRYVHAGGAKRYPAPMTLYGYVRTSQLKCADACGMHPETHEATTRAGQRAGG